MKIQRFIYIILIYSILLFLQGCSFIQYRLSVNDVEIVKHNESMRTSISVYNENIETDAGRYIP